MYMGELEGDLEGLGVVFSDLPNGGHNLRLYTYDPPGSQYYSAGGWIYNTGHYDVSLAGGPCSMSDPQGFNDSSQLNTYAQNHGESLVLVSRADLAGLCAYRPPATQQAAVTQPVSQSFGPPTVGAPSGGAGGSTSIILTGGGNVPPASVAQPSLPPPIYTVPNTAGIDTGTPQPIIAPAPEIPSGVYLAAAAALFFLIRGIAK